MQQSPNPMLRLLYRWLPILSILLVMLSIAMVALAVKAHATNQTSNPQSYIKLNQQGAIAFSPSQITMYAKIQDVGITNTTGQTIDLYLNGQFLESMPPGGWVGSSFNYPGT